MNLRLKKLGILSVAKIYGLFGVIFGLIIGVLAALVAVTMGTLGAASAGDDAGGMLAMTAGMGCLYILLFPLLYGVICFIGGALSAWIFNFVAPRAGGLEMEFNQDDGPAA